MNKGLIPGLNPDSWVRFPLDMRTAGNGGETQPSLNIGTGRSQFGRYNIIDKQLVVVEIQAGLFSATDAGSGSAFVFKLPFPANRWSGPGSAPIPFPMADGSAYLSIVHPAVYLPIVPTLADPFPSLGGDENNYVQAYCPYILSWGTGVLDGGTPPTATITHRCGYTPRAEDIEITFTDATTITSGAAIPNVQSIGATTFAVKASGSSAAAAFSWRVRGKPPTGSTGALVSPTTPWDWSRVTTLGPFGNIFLQFAYEPRR